MADLSPEQLNFLRTHLGYDDKGYLAKRKLKAQLQDFWGRRDKTNAELTVLPPDHPQLQAMKKIVADASKKAEGGDLKGAYADLKQVKLDARQEANLEKGGLSAQLISNDVQLLDNLVKSAEAQIAALRAKVDTQTTLLVQRATALPDPDTANGREDILTLAGNNAREKSEILGAWVALQNAVQTDLAGFAGTLAASPKISMMSDRVAHRIALLNQQQPGKLKNSDNALYLGLHARIQTAHLTGRGAELNTEISTEMTAQENILRPLLAHKTAFGPLVEKTSMTDKNGNALTGEDADAMKKEMAERFKHLEAEETKRMERAQEAYKKAIEQDQAVLNITRSHSPTRDGKVRSFDTASVTDEVPGGLMTAAMDDDAVAKVCADTLNELLRGMLIGDGKRPDEALEMCSRSPEDWTKAVAEAAGVPYSKELRQTIDAKTLARIDKVAAEMQKKAIEVFPDKAAPDFSSITVGGVTYGEVKQLGSGGGGIVYSAIDATGNKVVFKRPKNTISGNVDEEALQGAREEMLNHHAASGGDSGECHNNILDMKGMILGPEGEALIVMDLAESGDADDYAESVDACEATGLIPEGARQAMMAAAFRDMVRGVKAMQDQGMTHHDLKELNVFLQSDGTFKVADFGLAQHMDERNDAVEAPEEFTPGYESPEQFGEGDVTQKSDNFTLGVILDKMTDPDRGRGRHQENFSSSQAVAGPRDTTDGGPSTASSLDRVMNALKDPDPDKRPTLDAVLLSSYVSDVAENEEAIDRLKAATAEYAKTAGRQTSKKNQELTSARGDIRKAEADKTDALTLEKIANFTKLKQEQVVKLRMRKADQTKADDALLVVQQLIGQEDDDVAKAELQKQEKKLDKAKALADRMVRNAERSLTGTDEKIDDLQATLGRQRSAAEIAELDKKIARLREDVVRLTREIEEIHADPKFAAIVQELKEAGASFR